MIIAVIPAKGQSNRLPNKNMSDINGRPMLDFTIEYARGSKLISNVYVSTEDAVIAEHCKRLGVDVISRDASLCGETPIIDVYRDAYTQLDDSDIDALVGLQPDHPDRVLAIDEVIDQFIDRKVEQLISTEADGTKNGAHYILSKKVLLGKDPDDILSVVDDCTNVHFTQDIEKAAHNLARRSGVN